MDNITHSLIGVGIAHLFKKKTPELNRAAVWTAVIASNLPDLDFLSRSLGSDGGLIYLVQHRGYTHTLLLAMPVGMVAAFLGIKLGRLKEKQENREIFRLIAIGTIGVLMHVFMDWCNSYGVHPFSPFWNRWYYGDRIFIIEPLLWFCLLPLIFHITSSSWFRALSLGLGVFMMGLVWTGWFTTGWVIFWVSLWALVFVFLQSQKPQAIRYAFFGFILTLITFGASSSAARKLITQDLFKMAPQVNLIQLSMTPGPSNPLCWQFTGLSIENSNEYVARTGTISLAPKVLDPRDCHFFSRFQGNGILTAIKNEPENPNILFAGEYRRPLHEFHQLRNSDCNFDALLRSSRIPFWWTDSKGSWVSDLRFERGSESRTFFRVKLGSSEGCPVDLPNWEYPVHQVVEIESDEGESEKTESKKEGPNGESLLRPGESS